jgi:hypothetical protein
VDGDDRLTRAAAHDKVRALLPDFDAPAFFQDSPKLPGRHVLEAWLLLIEVSMAIVTFTYRAGTTP